MEIGACDSPLRSAVADFLEISGKRRERKHLAVGGDLGVGRLSVLTFSDLTVALGRRSDETKTDWRQRRHGRQSRNRRGMEGRVLGGGSCGGSDGGNKGSGEEGKGGDDGQFFVTDTATVGGEIANKPSVATEGGRRVRRRIGG